MLRFARKRDAKDCGTRCKECQIITGQRWIWRVSLMGLGMTALHTTIGCLSNGTTTPPAYDAPSAQYRAAAPSAYAVNSPFTHPVTAPSAYADSAPSAYAFSATPAYVARDSSGYGDFPLDAPAAPRTSAPLVALPIGARPAAATFATTAHVQLPADFEPRVPTRAWKYIVLHHSATADGDVRSIDGDHRGRTDSSGQPWLGIGYHFVIGNGGAMRDGEVEATFRWRDQLQGAHAGSRNYNEQGIGICLIGDFEKSPPTPQQILAARRLVAQLADSYGIPRTNCLRHSEIHATECPGRLFPWGQIVGPRRPVEK